VELPFSEFVEIVDTLLVAQRTKWPSRDLWEYRVASVSSFSLSARYSSSAVSGSIGSSDIAGSYESPRASRSPESPDSAGISADLSHHITKARRIHAFTSPSRFERRITTYFKNSAL